MQPIRKRYFRWVLVIYVWTFTYKDLVSWYPRGFDALAHLRFILVHPGSIYVTVSRFEGDLNRLLDFQ